MSFRRSKVPKFIPIVSLLILLVLGPIVFSFLQNASGVEAAWVDDNFSYRNAIPITSHTAAESNVYISATIDTSASGQFQSDCGDLRFTTVGGDILPYYIVSGCVSASTVVHVFFKSMPAGAQTIYYYYGNPSAANGFSSSDFSTQASSYALGSVASQEKGGAPIAYWKFDEGTGTTTKDSSSNSNTGTITNAIWKEESLCANGKCLYYDGSGDYVTVSDPSNGVLDFGTSQNFTVAAWAKIQNPTAYHSFLGKCGQDNTCPGYEFFLNGSTIYFRMTWTGGPQYGTSVTTTYDIRDNNWHYMVAVVDRTAEKVYLYGDGKLLNGSGGSITGVGNIDNSNDLTIGTAGAGAWKGFLDDAKLYNYARTAAQIKSDFKSRGTAKGTSVGLGSKISDLGSLSNGLVGYWKMDESSWTNDCSTTSVTDSSGNGNNASSCPNGTGPTGGNPGKYGNGGTLNGTSQYLTSTLSTSLQPTRATLALWWKADSTGAYQYVIDTNGDHASYGYTIQVNPGLTGYYVTFGNVGQDKFTSYTFTAGTWYHITTTYDGSNIITFINGSQQSSFAISSSPNITYSGGALNIGRNNNNSLFTKGTIDEVRIYNRALSPREVRDLYAFAPGPVAYYNFDEKSGTNLYDTSGSGFNSSSFGGSSVWSTGKFGSALSFNKNAYIDMGDISTLDNMNHFTVEAWIKPTDLATTPSNEVFISKVNGNCTGNGWRLEQINAAIILNCGSVTYTSVTLPDNNWHHVAFSTSNDGTNYTSTPYLDGIKGTATTHAVQSLSNAFNLYFGSYTNGDYTYAYDGKIDDVRIYNYARTQKQIVEDMNAGHPAGGSPVGSQVSYWKFDEGYGTTANNSGSGTGLNGTLTCTGKSMSCSNPSYSNDGKFGKTLNFSGSGNWTSGKWNYVTASPINNPATTGSKLTISLWVKPDSSQDNGNGWLVRNGIGTDENYGYFLTSISGGNFQISLQTYTTTWAGGTTTGRYVPASVWSHLALVFSQGEWFKVYVNGQLKETVTISGLSALSTSSFNIGGHSGSNQWFNGNIDEVKIYNAELTSDEIALDYNRGQAMVLGTLSDTSGLTGGSVASSSASAEYCIPGDTATCSPPVARWDFEEGSGVSANDISGNALTGTLVNSATWASGKLGKAGDFNGASVRQGVQVSNNALLNPGTGSITTQAWIKTSQTGSWKRIVTKRGSTTTWYSMGINSGKLAFETAVSYPTYYTTGSGNKTINDGQWHHVVMVRDTAQSKVLLYVDGQLDINPSDGTVGQSITNSEIFEIGIWGTEAYDSGSYTGKIDGVKIFNYARTPAQIAWDYNRGAPVGHWRLDECQGATAKDSSGNGNNGTITIGATGTQTAVGTCTTSGTAWYNGVTGKFNSSLNFDGTDDYINNTDNDIYSFGNGTTDRQFSASAWVKTNTTASQGIVTKYGTGGADTKEWVLYLTSSNYPGFYVQDNSASAYRGRSYNSALSTGTWYHIVGIYDGGGLTSSSKIYVNGKQVDNADITTGTYTAMENGTAPLSIGITRISDLASPFSGQIDDVRIYNYALTATQVKNLYNGGAAVKFAPLTGSP